MTEDEKRGFRNGCCFILNMMCRLKEKLKAQEEARLANCYGVISKAELEEIGVATDFYAIIGEKVFDPSEGEKK